MTNDYIPVTATGQAEYVSKGPTVWEKLARIWECENENRNRGLDGATPDGIGKKRIDQFWQTWRAYAKGQAQ